MATKPKPTMREAQKSRVQAEVLSVATRLIMQHGYESVTVQQIAAEAGISRRAFFHHFRAKDDLMFSRANGYGQFILDTLLEKSTKLGPSDNLEQTMVAFAERFAADQTNVSHVIRTYYEIPELRGRLLGEVLNWETQWAAVLMKAYPVPKNKAYIYHTMVSSAFSTFNSTVLAWAASGEKESLGKAIKKALDVLKLGWVQSTLPVKAR